MQNLTPLSPYEIIEKQRQIIPKSLIAYINNKLLYSKPNIDNSITIQKGQFIEKARKESGFVKHWWFMIKSIYEEQGWIIEETDETYVFNKE